MRDKIVSVIDFIMPLLANTGSTRFTLVPSLNTGSTCSAFKVVVEQAYHASTVNLIGTLEPQSRYVQLDDYYYDYYMIL